MSKKGNNYEKEIANEIHMATTSEVGVYPVGYSGNHAIPAPDVLVTTPHTNFAIELKKYNCDDGECRYVGEEDIMQLYDCGNTYTVPLLAIKFSNRELLCGPPTNLVLLDAFDTMETSGGSLRFRKPTLDQWPSAQSGMSDVGVVLQEMSLHTLVDEYVIDERNRDEIQFKEAVSASG